MRVKAIALRWLVLLSVLSVVAFITVANILSISSILSTIFSGIFGSSFVSLAMVAVEYYESKILTLEHLYIENDKIKKFVNRNLRFILPEEMVISNNEIKKVAKGYMNIANYVDIRTLGFLYADTYFAFNTSKREWIYNNVYNKQRSYINSIKEEERHLKAIITSENGHIPRPAIEAIERLQKKFYSIKEDERGTSVFMAYCEDIDTSDDEILKIAYGKKYIEPIKISYLYTIYNITVPIL